MSDHPELESLIAAYVLGAAEPEEEEAIRTHLAGCAECRLLAARLERAVDALPMATVQEHPPARLKAGILAAAAASTRGQPLPPVAVRSPRRTSSAGGRSPLFAAIARRPMQLAVAVLVVLAVGLGGWNVWLVNQLSRSQDQVAKTTLTGSGQLAGAEANVVDLRAEGVVLVSFSRLPPLPADRVYELWLIPSGRQPEPAGVFRPDLDGSKTLVIVKDLKRYKVIAVTVEASPNGAAAPTQAPSIAGNTGY
jgi:anti-sigma-K factor RskA